MEASSRLLGSFRGPLGGLLEASWARPGGLRGPGGGSRGAPEAENTVKTMYFHVFCRVSGGPGDPPKFESAGSGTVIFTGFGPGGGDYRRGGN